jgi:hypothetical protein
MASVSAECSHEAKQFFVLLAVAAQWDVDRTTFEPGRSKKRREDT